MTFLKKKIIGANASKYQNGKARCFSLH